MASFQIEACLGVLVLAFSLLGQQSYAWESKASYPKPSECFKLECPQYNVVDTHNDFQIRSYKSALWVSNPPVNSSNYKAGSDFGFYPLFDYFSGKNREGVKIPMTAPVLVDITPSIPPTANSTYITYFYLPQKYQANPPHAGNVIPITLPERRYAAVRRFGGFLSNNIIPGEVEALKESLKGTPYESAIQPKRGGSFTYTVAGYDTPFKKVGRVNEILFWF